MNPQQEKDMIESLKEIAGSLNRMDDRFLSLIATIWIIAILGALLLWLVFG